MKIDLHHGGALDKMRDAFPDAPGPWIDLSTGINPWPWTSSSVNPAAFYRLPTEDAMTACRRAMAAAIEAPPQSILLAPGSEILIRLLPSILCPKKVAILHPTYGDHTDSWQRAGAQIIETDDPLSEAHAVDTIVLCNPNNPDGRRFDTGDLMAALKILHTKGGCLIVDEAYADLTPELSLTSHGGTPGLIVLRSLGKFFGLAGVRLGAIIATSSVLQAMSNLLGVWNVSGPALEIGTSAYGDLAWQRKTRCKLKEARARLDTLFETAGLQITGGTDLFRFVKTQNALDLWTHLARQGIYVRRFAYSDHHLRIGLPGDNAAKDRLRRALNA